MTANGTAGPYDVIASAAGATSVNFSLTNTPGCSSAITVTNNADSGAGSLRQAIADVCPGGTITFNSDYTITLTSGELAIGKDVTIDGQTNNVAVSGNNASRVFNITSGNVTLNKLTIANGNASGSSGGGIFNSGTLTVTNSTISGNLADDGGGMYNNSSSPTLTNVTFSGNSATYGPGGGMYNNSSSPTLTNVTFSGNSATQVGGGMFNQSSSNPTLTNVTFSGNWAYSGGGMYNWVSSSPTLTNVTFRGNSATNAGGGMYNTYLSSPTLKNVIIANSTSGGDCVNNSVTLDASSSNNLIEDAANSCGLTDGSNGNIVGKDPLLGSLGSYGGATQTVPLLPGSPAINAGNAGACPLTDRRGVSRVGACDIGAFESRGFTLTKSGGDGQSTAVSTPFTNPLVVTVSSGFSEPVNGGQVTFTAPSSGASTNPAVNTATIASGAVRKRDRQRHGRRTVHRHSQRGGRDERELLAH